MTQPAGRNTHEEKGLTQMRRAMSKLLARLRRRGDDGMTTVEYAVGTLAAVAFAGVLLKVLTSDTVQAALTALVQRALR
jgi:hypothetical protein